MKILKIEGLAKRFGEIRALDGVSLEVARGEILAVLGPNGAGKTTMVSAIAGLLRPDAGTVHVEGIDVLAEPQRIRQYIGLAPQELAVYPTLTVLENLRYIAQLRGLRAKSLRKEVERCAELLCITQFLRRRAGRLSGGEKRRLHTAIALLGSPPLVLLDEPTAGVDVSTRYHILDAVRELALSGCAICYSSHYLVEIEELQPRVAVLNRGRLVGTGSVEELVASHARPEVHVLFAGVAPELPNGWCGQRRDSSWVIESARPTSTASQLLRVLDDAEVAGIEIRQANLEQAFLSLSSEYPPRVDIDGAS
jgi:ABC-2 type transport system ATP-binding protein